MLFLAKVVVASSAKSSLLTTFARSDVVPRQSLFSLSEMITFDPVPFLLLLWRKNLGFGQDFSLFWVSLISYLAVKDKFWVIWLDLQLFLAADWETSFVGQFEFLNKFGNFKTVVANLANLLSIF